MAFKASKIKKFKFVVPETTLEQIRQKSLTRPQAPKLHTKERAHLKDDLMDVSK